MLKDKEQSTENNFKTKHLKSKKNIIIFIKKYNNVLLFIIQHLQTNLNEFTGYCSVVVY